nr:MAG TPA: hypothetical protein [Caudoviricetes sp.]
MRIIALPVTIVFFRIVRQCALSDAYLIFG